MKFRFLLLVVSIFLSFLACQNDKISELEDGLYAKIETETGDIILELFAKQTPLTVSNFVALAEGNHPLVSDSLQGKNYYDGLTFHRVVDDFMIQGGDPLGNGRGGPGYVFEDEFPKDSVGNLTLKHDVAGVLSMANTGANANGSQFFITHKATPWLDGVHTVFGEVVFGQKVVDSISQNEVMEEITIVRKGAFAEAFNAPEVFKSEKKRIAKQQEKEALKLLEKQQRFLDSLGFSEILPTPSGLKIIMLKKGVGKKITAKNNISVVLSVYLANGKLISKSNPDNPYEFSLEKQPLIAGVKEALLTMREGDRKHIFVPYQLGYGEKPNGPIPAKSDLVFEIEILKVR